MIPRIILDITFIISDNYLKSSIIIFVSMYLLSFVALVLQSSSPISSHCSVYVPFRLLSYLNELINRTDLLYVMPSCAIRLKASKKCANQGFVKNSATIRHFGKF